MTVDKIYCMSSWLMHRNIIDKNKQFADNVIPKFIKRKIDGVPINNSHELGLCLEKQVETACRDGKAVLALSGGIDSAVLAKYMPAGSSAYTFKCVVPNKQVVDETIQAAKYASECGLNHKIVNVSWEDMIKYAPILMKRKGMPIHSIEVQIYKAALKAKEEGFSKMIFGETADIHYGGLDKLLSRNWTYDEYLKRFSYLLPSKVLKEYVLEELPYKDSLMTNGLIDVHKHLLKWDILESIASYENACELAGIEFVAPYSNTYLNKPLDYERIKKGDSKYFVREVFSDLYRGWDIPNKIPMPRPMDEWLKDWEGPVRKEFLPNCVSNLKPDEKWLVYALEMFLNMIER